jgi:hypothetical protein
LLLERQAAGSHDIWYYQKNRHTTNPSITIAICQKPSLLCLKTVASLGLWPFLVFQDQAKISRLDVARLTNVGDESISSLSAIADMKRKLERLYG